MIEISISPQRLYVGEDTDLTVTLTNVDKGTCRNIVFRLDLPSQITRLAGDCLIDTDRLASGESERRSLRVRADEAGNWQVSSSNFSYRDRLGSSVRPVDYVGRLMVVHPVRVEEQPPCFAVDLVGTALPQDKWGDVQVQVTNTGDTVARDLGMALRGPFRVDNGGPSTRIPMLPPGGSAEFSFSVLATESGTVPVHVELTSRYGRQQGDRQQWTVILAVGTPSVAPDRDGMTVLYLSANPMQTVRLRVQAELREIQDEVRRGLVSRLRVTDRGATRARDISDALLNVRPRIVHFSGHGAADGRLYLERDNGNSHLVTPSSLAKLFREASDDVECVIVNACSTELLAQAIVQYIDYVIAMRDAVPDQAAIAFSIGFYQALAAGKQVDEAYRYGRNQIHLQMGDDFADLPVLLRRATAGGAGARSI